jgi:Ca2+-binding EF-hand superfamily protein
MKLIHSRMLVATLAVAISLPVAFAAKGGGKKKDASSQPEFSVVDKDTDGSISQAEYVAAMKDKLGEEGAKSKFAELDKDKNGSLSKEEYAAGETPAKKKRKKNQ